jgi:pantoate--beta-alanine ligase
MSSRNTYLTPEQRVIAPNLYIALLAGARAAGRPGVGARDVITTVTMVLAQPDAGLGDGEHPRTEPPESPAGPPRFTIDYVSVVNADSFVQESDVGPRSLLIAAARLGATRLIDNIPLASAYPAGDATD